MRQFCECQLERTLDDDERQLAAMAIRDLDRSPAWFRIRQKLRQMNESYGTPAIAAKPVDALSERAIGAHLGFSQAIAMLPAIFDEITREVNDVSSK